ncbi:MAG: hypothetical protein KAG37_09275, partial [Flavobacteriales bacterium]|nr:hypothetical protein [Flavobacteriales bacterium]
MKLTLKINYHTHWGQRLFVTGNVSELGNNNKDKAIEMGHFNGEQWELVLELKVSKITKLEYYYFVKDETGRVISEWGDVRGIELNPILKKVLVVYDQWKAEGNPQNVFYT